MITAMRGVRNAYKAIKWVSAYNTNIGSQGVLTTIYDTGYTSVPITVVDLRLGSALSNSQYIKYYVDVYNPDGTTSRISRVRNVDYLQPDFMNTVGDTRFWNLLKYVANGECVIAPSEPIVSHGIKITAINSVDALRPTFSIIYYYTEE